MGSSAKKRKDKKKDFQKPKLKVGKARPKPTNFTNTNFNSKSIVLNQQSIAIAVPSATSQFSHHLSLLTSRTDSQRKDSLSYLATAISTRPTNAPLQLPVSALFPKILPLMRDSSHAVRTQLLRLLRTLPANEVEDGIGQLLLHVRAGITHLAVDIRSTSLDILMWALECCGSAVVSCPGGWVKTLKTLMIVHGWTRDTNATSSTWSSYTPSSGMHGTNGTVMTKNLNAMALLLRCGFEEEEPQVDTRWGFPLTDTASHMISKRSNCFAYLNLFGPVPDEEGQGYEDREDRQRVFQKILRAAMDKGLKAAKQEAGEVGRAAANVQKAISEGMKDFEEFEYGLQSSSHRRINSSKTN